MKHTKRSLLTSVTALLLFFVMLVGTTFAWFTDEVNSANNIIQAGNLQAGMFWSPSKLEADSTDWKNAEADPIFSHKKWEPGYTEVKYIKVTNDGSLAFKYQMLINPTGNVGKLAEVIDVSFDIVTGNTSFVAPTADNKQGSLTKVGTLQQLISGTGSVAGGVLLPEGEEKDGYYSGSIVICVSLHMQELAGNDYQNKSIGDSFGINLYATQFDYESDSFGSDYDDGATWPDNFRFEASANIDDIEILGGELQSSFIIRYNDSIYAELPAGVKIAEGATEIRFSGRTADGENNLTLGDDDSAKDYDIHIEGIADNNTQPIKVYLGKLLEPGLNKTSLKLYHEDDLMTGVESVSVFAINNQYFYDENTGEVVLYVDNFSIFSSIITTADIWDGTSDITWYNENATEFVLENAEQLAGFRDLVDGGNTFAGKTVKLGKDIDLNRIPFDPIGFGYWKESNVVEGNDKNTVFMGTFDGGHHTIYNLYENCWELDTDKEKYSTYTYSTAGAGLFASIKNATIKNLAISGAEIVFECVDMGVVVGYAQGECYFENIVVTNANIANYNRYTGGVVGEVSYGPYGTDVEAGYSHVFKNVTVDSSVTVSGLWGSFGCGMGGVIGGKWGDATVKMENVVSAPVMDVYNDVVSAYQWYAFRGCGMLIGHTEEPYSDGRHSGNATASFLTCENVKVYYGDWVDYNYYRFSNQTDAQGNTLWYSNYPWVRAEGGKYCDAFSNIRYGIPLINGVKVTEVDGKEAEELADEHVVITFDQLYGADLGMYGTADHPGVTVLKENVKTIYFQNNWKWTDIKLEYWYENGEDRWTNLATGGISIDSMKIANDGDYDVYRIDLPAYVAGFKLTGFDNTTQARNQTPEILEESIVEGNVYWFIYANNEKSMGTSKYEPNFQRHDIYLVGNMNDWTPSDEYRLTPSADGKTWTGTFTIENQSEVKLYNKLVVNENARYIAANNAGDNFNTKLAPGVYKITYYSDSYSEESLRNKFTYELKERMIYLNPGDWNQDGAWYQAWTWGGSEADAWITFTDSDGDGIFEAFIPIDRTGMKLLRKGSSHAANEWIAWNQTGDIPISDNSQDLFTITNPWGNGAGQGSNGSWSTK